MSDRPVARTIRIIFDTSGFVERLEELHATTRWLHFDITYGPWIGAAVILGSLAIAWAGAVWGAR